MSTYTGIGTIVFLPEFYLNKWQKQPNKGVN